MTETKNNKEAAPWPATLTADLSQPVVLEQDGNPAAVLMSLEDYEHYQALLA